MAKTTLSSIANVPDLITAFLAQLVSDGWTQVGALNIYKSSADAAGRVMFIGPFEDTVGNFMVQTAPALNAAGDNWPDAWMYTNRGCDFTSGDWTLYSTAQSFFLVKGTTNNSQRVWGGRFDTILDASIETQPWSCFITGSRRLNSVTAYTNYLLGKGTSAQLRATILWTTPWNPAHLPFIGQTNTIPSNMAFSFDNGWYDGRLVCYKPLICSYGATSQRTEKQGILGRLPDVIMVAKNIDIVPGDTVTLDDGAKYEFREHTLYWDEFNQMFLLWRMN